MEEELKVPRDQLVSLGLLEEWDHQVKRVLLVNLDHWDFLEKKVHVVSEEIMVPLADKAREGQQDHQEVQETKETLEKMVQRALMVRQVLLELLVRGEL